MSVLRPSFFPFVRCAVKMFEQNSDVNGRVTAAYHRHEASCANIARNVMTRKVWEYFKEDFAGYVKRAQQEVEQEGFEHHADLVLQNVGTASGFLEAWGGSMTLGDNQCIIPFNGNGSSLGTHSTLSEHLAVAGYVNLDQLKVLSRLHSNPVSFGCLWICLDDIWMCLVAFGCVWLRLDVFGVVLTSFGLVLPLWCFHQRARDSMDHDAQGTANQSLHSSSSDLQILNDSDNDLQENHSRQESPHSLHDSDQQSASRPVDPSPPPLEQGSEHDVESDHNGTMTSVIEADHRDRSCTVPTNSRASSLTRDSLDKSPTPDHAGSLGTVDSDSSFRPNRKDHPSSSSAVASVPNKRQLPRRACRGSPPTEHTQSKVTVCPMSSIFVDSCSPRHFPWPL